MSANIKPGDTVQIVRWPCCGCRLGNIFVVANIFHDLPNFICRNCGHYERFSEPVAWEGTTHGNAARLSWLTKFEPPTEVIETVREVETS